MNPTRAGRARGLSLTVSAATLGERGGVEEPLAHAVTWRPAG